MRQHTQVLREKFLHLAKKYTVYFLLFHFSIYLKFRYGNFKKLFVLLSSFC